MDDTIPKIDANSVLIFKSWPRCHEEKCSQQADKRIVIGLVMCFDMPGTAQPAPRSTWYWEQGQAAGRSELKNTEKNSWPCKIQSPILVSHATATQCILVLTVWKNMKDITRNIGSPKLRLCWKCKCFLQKAVGGGVLWRIAERRRGMGRQKCSCKLKLTISGPFHHTWSGSNKISSPISFKFFGLRQDWDHWP